MDANFETLLAMIDAFGSIGILVFLVITCRNDLRAEQLSHEATRKEYREDLRDRVIIKPQIGND